MEISNSDQTQIELQWKRFSNLLWFDKNIGMWLDISKMKINDKDFDYLKNNLNKSLLSMKEIESGKVANISESRQVGHYWLRNSKFAPNIEFKNSVDQQKKKIKEFSNNILSEKILSSNNKPFKNVLWIGIGGSSLGPILIINALKKFKKGLNFYFLDNVDPTGIKERLEEIEEELINTLIVVVSKSGGTLEPKICMEQARYKLESIGGNWSSQAIAITMKNSNLYKQAKNEDWLNIFDLQDWVGGRTSITSSVGLLPISLIECQVDKFLEGASAMDQSTRNTEISQNPAALLAASWYVSGDGKGKKDMVILPYKDRLEVFSKYLQQLVMESLGKKYDRAGNIVNQGISVYGNKGSTDQHAYIQQLRDGLDNFFAIFIEIIKEENKFNFDESMNPNHYLSGFLQGTRRALTEANKESITITISELNEFSLGALIALFERTVGIYSELININAYDQPGVEAGKIAAADVIKKQKLINNIINTGNLYTVETINEKLDNNSFEQVFWIIRSLYINDKIILKKGSWDNPISLEFTKKN